MQLRALPLLVSMLFLLLTPARAEEVVLGLSKDHVSITANFDGSDILIFGAVKRQTPLLLAPMEVVVTISGPSEPIAVRRKDHKLGIWVNSATVNIDSAPSFYAVATSAPLRQAMTNTEDLRHKVSIPLAIRSVGAPDDVGNSQYFTDALIRIRKNAGLYQILEGGVEFREETLFNTSIQLPANLTEGAYETRIFLTRNGKVVTHYETTIQVRKVGLERFLYNLSRNQPMIYGLMALVIAVVSGWGASTLFMIWRQR